MGFAEDAGQFVATRCQQHEAIGTEKQGQMELSCLSMSTSSKAKSSTDRHEGVGDPGGAGGCCILKVKGQKALCFMSNREQTDPQPSFCGSSFQWRSSAALEIRLWH